MVETSSNTGQEAAPSATEALPTWLVGVDGSTHANHALAWATQMAAHDKARLRVVRSWDPPSGLLGGIVGRVLGRSDEDQDAHGDDLADELATYVADAAAFHQVPVESSLIEGPAGRVLLDEAAGADLVIVGSRGRGGFASLMLGSVGLQVATHCSRPTIVVPSPPRPIVQLRKVIVGVDSTRHCMDALRWADEFAPASAEITALKIWQAPYGGGPGTDLFTPLMLSGLAESHETAFGLTVDEAERALGRPGRFTRRFELGHPSQTLCEFGADADLLVLGAPRPTGGHIGSLGSTTSQVLHNLTCPTAVVRTHGSPERGA